jgi:hypothetical protein
MSSRANCRTSIVCSTQNAQQEPLRGSRGEQVTAETNAEAGEYAEEDESDNRPGALEVDERPCDEREHQTYRKACAHHSIEHSTAGEGGILLHLRSSLG